MKATLKQYRQSPRKVRLVANLIRGKQVVKAMTELSFLNKRAALPFKKLLSSAIASAKHDFKTEKEELSIGEITVDQGPTLHRRRARARGRANPINKRTSNITIVLKEQTTTTKK